MATEDLIKWWETNYFDVIEFQKDLLTYFEESDVVDGAVDSKKWQGTEVGLKNSIEHVLEIKAKDITNENISKGLSELGGLTGLSSEGKTRVDDRQEEISIDIIEKSTSLRDADTNFDNITANLGDVGKVRETRILTIQAEKVKELARITPEQLTREQLLDKDILGVAGTSFSKTAGRIGISEDVLRPILEREGFTIENNRIKK